MLSDLVATITTAAFVINARHRTRCGEAIATTPATHVVGAVNRREFQRHQDSKNGCHCIGCQLHRQAREAGARARVGAKESGAPAWQLEH